MTALNITILDTGFATAKHTGSQISTSNRVNSGNAFTIKSKTVTPTSAMLGSGFPEVGSLTDAEYNIGSLEVDQITIRGILNTNVGEDVSMFYKLWNLPRTYGYKAVFYPVDSTVTDTGGNSTLNKGKQVINLLSNGHVDTTENQGDIDMDGIIWTGTSRADNKDLTDVEHIHVIFTRFTPIQDPNTSFIKWQLAGAIIPEGP